MYNDTYLALVHAVVAPLHKLDLQRPRVGAGRVQNGESLVVGVHLGAGREDVPVAPSDPRDLILQTCPPEPTERTEPLVSTSSAVAAVSLSSSASLTSSSTCGVVVDDCVWRVCGVGNVKCISKRNATKRMSGGYNPTLVTTTGNSETYTDVHTGLVAL